jgi:outer membrane protein assembly factor BamE (lipoprotein component of BamABCDE complex)
MTRAFFYFFVILCCNACIKTTHISGHLFEEKEIEQLKTVNNKQQLTELLGTPTSVSDFGPETWYYITTKKESVAFFQDKVVEQNIIAVSFAKGDKIVNITKYSEKDMKNHSLAPEITIVRGNEATTAQQFFHNVGRYNKNKKKAPSTPRSGF